MSIFDAIFGNYNRQRDEDYLHSEQAQIDYRNALKRWRNNPHRTQSNLPSPPPCMTNRSKEMLAAVLATDVELDQVHSIQETRRQGRPGPINYGNEDQGMQVAGQAMGAASLVMQMLDPSRFGQPMTADEADDLEYQRREAALNRMPSPAVYYAAERERQQAAQQLPPARKLEVMAMRPAGEQQTYAQPVTPRRQDVGQKPGSLPAQVREVIQRQNEAAAKAQAQQPAPMAAPAQRPAELARHDKAPMAAPAQRPAELARHDKAPRPARRPEPTPILVENWPKPVEKSIFDRMMEGE